MAIKSNSEEKITATDINALIDKIQEEYQGRPVTTTGTDRSGANASVNLKTLSESLNNVSKNDTIGSNLYNVVNTILVMNDVPNLLINEQYDIIISDGIKNNADLKDSLPTTCRGACMGTCTSGCSGNSQGSGGTYGSDGTSYPRGAVNTSNGPGQTDCTNCSGACGANCKGTCSGGCNSCSSACSSNCSSCSGCWSSCGGSCGGCKGCTGNCGSACTTGCHNTCKNNCDANCTNGCALNCKDGCYGSAKNNTYT